MNTKKLTISAMLVSIGIVLGNVVYIPMGVSKCFPIQHTINFLSAIILGPLYGTGIAFSISALRNILGTGSFLAFPGSMIGVLLAGILYNKTKNRYITALGEIVGTGLLGGLVAVPIAKYFIGKEVAIFFFVYSFLLSTITGTVIGLILLKVIESSKAIKLN